MENEIILQIQNRLKTLLFDNSITSYRDHEIFASPSGQEYQFLVWKLQPLDWDKFSNEIQHLVEEKGYQCIPDAWDVTTYDPVTKTGYKVVALYIP